MTSARHKSQGFTLVEVSIILLVLVILSTILIPQMGGFNRLARYTRTREDLGAICSVLKAMLDDVGENALYSDPGSPHVPRRGELPVGLLIGDGDVPFGPTGGADPRGHWALGFGERFSEHTDGGGVDPVFVVDTFANHLIHNTPLRDGSNHWRGPLDMPRGFNDLFGWRGPYLSDDVLPDPWGNRYMANVFALYDPQGAGALDRYASAGVCMSAGPDAEVATAFNQPFGWRTRDDDFTTLLSAGGPI